MESAISYDPLLSASDPLAVETYNAEAQSPEMLLCHDLAKLVPNKLQYPELKESAQASHIAWDIGDQQARNLSDRLQTPLIHQHVSRLAIECNRSSLAEEAYCEISDGMVIPGNVNPDKDIRSERRQANSHPLGMAMSDTFAAPKFLAAFSVHTCACISDEQIRPWNTGFATRKKPPLAEALIQSVKAQNPSVATTKKERDQIDDASVERLSERHSGAATTFNQRDQWLLPASDDGRVARGTGG